MDTLGKLTAAPITLELGGRQYDLTPLGMVDHAQFKRFLKGFIAKETTDAAEAMKNADAPDDEIKRLWEMARWNMEHTGQYNYLEHVECIVESVWLGLRKAHPEVTREQVGEMLLAEENLQKIVETEEELNTIEDETKKA